MKAPKWIAPLFWLAAVYDGVLGFLFMAAPNLPFEVFGVTPPNHPGYVQFPAALLVIFALMFAVVALDPVRNRNLIPYGILLKVAYCSVASLHWLTIGIPAMWKPLVVVDLVMGLLFVWAYVALAPRSESAEEQTTT